MKLRSLIVTAILTLCTVFFIQPTQAQDAPPAPIATPAEIIDQIMTQIGQGRIDEALTLMDGLNTQADLKEAARNRLVDLRSVQTQYRSYEIATVQRFTGKFQTINVLAYYDDQPVLYRFHFYRAQNQPNVKWTVLGFQAITAVQEISDLLKDTPVDYVGSKKAK